MNPDGSVDRNAVSICGERPVGVREFGLIDGSGGSDALKVTDSSYGEVHADHIIGGAEDCVDVNNHCASITVRANIYEPRGQYVITCKGGSRGTRFDGIVRGHGKTVDVDLGNVSDQSDDLTTGTVLNLVHEFGDPITVRILGADDPIYLNSSAQKYVVVFAIPKGFRGLFLKVYKQLKKVFPI